MQDHPDYQRVVKKKTVQFSLKMMNKNKKGCEDRHSNLISGAKHCRMDVSHTLISTDGSEVENIAGAVTCYA